MGSTEQLPGYEIRVAGHIDERWLRWFEGLVMTALPNGETLIRCQMDRASLHGLLNRIRDTGLELIALQRLPAQVQDQPEG